MAAKLGLNVEFIAGDWRHGADPQAIEKRLRADADKRIKAVCVVHNETSTGVTSRIAEVRRAIDAAQHPALFMVDTISSLASMDYRHDEWGVDVTVAGSQKGLMLPPGLSFNCISPKALTASKAARLPRSYWAWDEMTANGKNGYFPYTPATNLLYGLAEALKMLDEEGLDAVFARHQRHAEAARRAVRAWGLEVYALDPREYSASLTGVLMPAGHDADRLRKVILDAFELSLGTGLTKPVEIVVAAGAGGASDQMARMMQAAVQKNGLMKQPMVVSLKGGASGAEALMYMKSSAGDPNKVLIAYSLIYMLPLSAKIPFNWRELSPVSLIALDQFVLWDNTTLPHANVKDFIAAAKAANPPFKMGGTGSKREDHVLTVFIEKKTGAKFAYLPYKSGGEAATQLVGNHTQSNVNNPSENLEVWRAGQVRALCVFDKERIGYKTKVTDKQSWNDIPTCKEEGLDVQYLMLRAMFLPGKVTPEQAAFYVDLFKKVTQTAEYKDYMEKQALKPIFLTGSDMLKFLEEDDTLNKNLMTEAGFVAN